MIEPVVIQCEVIEPRVLSLLVVDKARVTAWLPRSAIGFEGDARVGAKLRISMSRELAIEKGLLAAEAEGQGVLL
ncbi:hypothetical protein LJR016_004296 [Devosia sp. LjRoot16]|uniref:hypothetical protein n=1 Tax=Devosia sp. LjRoot16 TaxID=3342271 RepID=UPI003ECE9775